MMLNFNHTFKFTFKLSVPIKNLKHIFLLNIVLKLCSIKNRDEYLADIYSNYKVNYNNIDNHFITLRH